jgi:hypothetical protein
MKALGKGSVASIVQVGLSIARWVLLVAAVLWAAATLAYAIFMGLDAAGVIDAASIPAVEGGQNGAISIQVSGFDPEAFRALKWTDWQIIAPGLLAGIVGIVGSLIIVERLRKLFESFSSGEPFRRENAQHLRAIWITMVVMELSRYAVQAILGLALGVFGAPDSVGRASFSLSSDNLSSWLSILILIVLAEVFREGARMKEEQELTI